MNPEINGADKAELERLRAIVVAVRADLERASRVKKAIQRLRNGKTTGISHLARKSALLEAGALKS